MTLTQAPTDGCLPGLVDLLTDPKRDEDDDLEESASAISGQTNDNGLYDDFGD